MPPKGKTKADSDIVQTIFALEYGERRSLEEVARSKGMTMVGFLRHSIKAACDEMGIPYRGTQPLDSQSRWSETNKQNRARAIAKSDE